MNIAKLIEKLVLIIALGLVLSAGAYAKEVAAKLENKAELAQAKPADSTDNTTAVQQKANHQPEPKNTDIVINDLEELH